ncbi:MAG: glutamate mutase L [Clostridia bacterium]|nr:glutamate mutase L [Clostridia bacterium]
MNNIMLIDFGSTFTKVCAVSLEKEILLGTAQAPTTVKDNILYGLISAVDSLERVTGSISYDLKLGCSSAAGGLSVMVSGLIESLTLEAAKMAALGAGAKITGSFHHELTDEDMSVIEKNIPDIFLLAGGTDGGNQKIILHNARKLASVREPLTVVVAGNRVVADEVSAILEKSGKKVYVCPNIMPSLTTMNTIPVNNIIRNLFISQITVAKGLKQAEKMVDQLLMPTPYAVLKAGTLLADGDGINPGLKELMIIDIGGATTDIHSICDGYSTGNGIISKGLVNPRIMRTVEGDLGVRLNADTIVEAAFSDDHGFFAHFTENDTKERLNSIKDNPSLIFDEKSESFDDALSKKAVNIAVKRHCGTLKKYYTPEGVTYLQFGKDMTSLPFVIGTGGPLLHSRHQLSVLRECLFDSTAPDSLRPKKPQFYLDEKYILAAMGLLSTISPVKAFTIMKKELKMISQESVNGN